MSEPITMKPTAVSVSADQATAKSSPTTIDARVKQKITLELVDKPNMDEILRTMSTIADFLSRFAGEALVCRVVSPLNPSMQGMLQSSATLTKSALDQIEEINQIKAREQQARGGGLVGPQGGPAPTGYRN